MLLFPKGQADGARCGGGLRALSTRPGALASGRTNRCRVSSGRYRPISESVERSGSARLQQQRKNRFGSLPRSVMVAQQVLVLLVEVRILAG